VTTSPQRFSRAFVLGTSCLDGPAFRVFAVRAGPTALRRCRNGRFARRDGLPAIGVGLPRDTGAFLADIGGVTANSASSSVETDATGGSG
jgi:hypothetical protein